MVRNDCILETIGNVIKDYQEMGVQTNLRFQWNNASLRCTARNARKQR
jgi:hypothetical protein